MISLDDVERKNYIKVFGGITRQRGALAMARIHEHLGNISEAKNFAQAGLNNIRHAIKLKPAFEEILNST